MAHSVNPSESPTAKAMDRAIGLAIDGKSPYPEHAAFIDADSPHAGHEIARAFDEGYAVVLVSTDGREHVITSKMLTAAPEGTAPVRSTPLLTEAQPLEGHAVHVCFADGTTADVDLSYLLDYGGVFEPLCDPDYFARLEADPAAGTIMWPNGADIAPETLYADAQRRAAATA